MNRRRLLYEYSTYFRGRAPLAFAAVSLCIRESTESRERGTLGCVTRIADGEAWRSLSIRSEECSEQLKTVEAWQTRPPTLPLKLSVTLKNDKASVDTVALLEEFSVRLERCGVHVVFFVKLNEINTLDPFGTLLSRAEEVALNGCRTLTSLDGLDGRRCLKRVDCNGCDRTDFSAIRTCALLEAATFSSWPDLTSLDALQGLQHLKSVTVIDCPITGLEALRTYPTLERVVCRPPHTVSLQPLEGLKCLKDVGFSADNVDDIDALHTCTALEVVDISGAVDLSSLERLLLRLRELMIESCGITSLDALHTCEALVELRVICCSSLTPVEHFKAPPSLKDIAISDCPISLRTMDVTPCPLLLSLDGLGGLPNLEEVRANGGGITDVAAISQCPALRYVDVRDCPQLQSVDVLLKRGDVKVDYNL
ncbi:hypothetical protein, conserved [Angomonas deanei]|uniref:BspA type Leucine rich repeat region (6 copies) n=1 Tax=Angomonas deanei TaxID=59799 RepID=A0A7G2C7B2_9TRYP|nr:hypothetical protein, conserved [Angomonas deanei]